MARHSAKSFKSDDLIDYDELLESSSMSGLVSFLTEIPSTSIGIPKEASGSIGIPNEPPTSVTEPENLEAMGLYSANAIGMPGDHVRPVGIPIEPLMPPGIPLDSSSTTGIPKELHNFGNLLPETQYAQLVATRRLRPFRMQIIQDGHSDTEQAVYWALWNAGTPISKTSWRSAQIGYGDLSRKANVSRNSVIRLLASLEKKMALKRLDGNTSQQGSCYTIYDFTTILDSRKKAGLLFAVRDRNAVHLLIEEEVTDAHKLSLGIPVDLHGTLGIPIEPTLGIPTNAPPLYRDLKRDNTSVGVAPEDLLTQIRKQTDILWDPKAIQALWTASSKRGVKTAEELMFFVVRKWKILQAKRDVTNPIGLMLKAVPESISRDALIALRAKPETADEQVSVGDNRREYFTAVLNDPDASEQEKRVAMRALG